MEATCIDLSVEGERLLKNHDYEGAIELFEAGLRAGTDDKEVLSAVYNQLGNACFYAGKYNKALEYHKRDLEIAEKIGDRQGMAKAYGNLGNTFKALNNFEKAIRCCEAHLEITREVKDRLGEGRACYNLGNVHHAVGKRKLNSNDPRSQVEGRQSVLKAIDYYKATLKITTELNDEIGEGRAVGNLGNAYTAVDEFHEAIKYHMRRLELANKANDLAAKARACGNLGNAYSALSEYTEAIRYYQLSLQVAKEDRNQAAQAQAHFCLGTTFAQQKNYVKSLEHHRKHLEFSEASKDIQAQFRAWHNLRNVYRAAGHMEKAKEYHEKIVAERQRRGETFPSHKQSQSASSSSQSVSRSTEKGDKKNDKAASKKKKKKVVSLFNFSGGTKAEVERFSHDDSEDGDEIVTSRTSATATQSKPKKGNAADQWLDASIQKSKDQLHSKQHQQLEMVTETPQPDMNSNSPTAEDDAMPFDLFDMLANANHHTMSDQRAVPPKIGNFENGLDPAGGGDFTSEEDFFDMLASMQNKRIDDQRAVGASEVERNIGPEAKNIAVPQQQRLRSQLDENMSLFEMLAISKNTK